MSLYMKSDDAEVIAAVERNALLYATFKEAGLAWAEERGCEEFYYGGFAGRIHVSGLPSIPADRGRWTKGKPHKPYKDNEVERQAMDALAVAGEPVPGMPDVLRAPGFLLYPTPFVHDGHAWIHFVHMPHPAEREKVGEQWTECLGSAYHAAAEAKNIEADR